jgi:hypothetical protein
MNSIKYITIIIAPLILVVASVLLLVIIKGGKKESFDSSVLNNDGNMKFPFLNNANNSKSIKDYAQIDNHKTNYISGRRILTRGDYGHYHYINI